MKKILSVLLILTMLLSAASCGGKNTETDTGKPEGPQYVLIAASTYNDDYHYVTGMKEFEKEVEEKSGGRIDVRVYGSGAIAADDRQSAEMLSNNEIQFGMAESSMMSAIFNDNRIGAATIPFYFPINAEESYKVFDNGKAYQKLFEELDTKHRVHVVGVVSGGRSVVINKVRANTDMESCKGLKIRCGENAMMLPAVNAMGFIATPLAWGDVYTALQQNTIDGCFSNLEGMYNMKFFEQCKYVLDYPVFNMNHIYAYSSDFYDSLPADLQAVLDEAGTNYMKYVREHGKANTEAIEDNLAKQGVTLVVPDDNFKKQLEDSEAEFIAQRRAEIPEFIAILDQDLIDIFGPDYFK